MNMKKTIKRVLTRNIRILRSIKIMMLFIFLIISCQNLNAQNVGVNNPTPHAKALLDLTSTDKGILIPRLTSAQRIAMFPVADLTAAGMMIYQTDLVNGFYYYDGNNWAFIGNSTSGWSTVGNSGTNAATNFIGTIDNNDLSMKTFNAEVVHLTTSKKVGIGTSTPGLSYAYAKLEIADEDGSNSDLMIHTAGASSAYPQLIFHKQNGTLASPTVISNGDWTGTIVGRGYDGNNFNNASAIVFGVDSAVAPNFLRGNILFQTTGGSSIEKMRIDRNGNVGIGTTAPQHKLTFGNALGSRICLWQGATTNYGIGVQPSTFQLYTATVTDDFVFGYGTSTSFSENVRIKGNGNVGVGLPVPLQKLDVNGNINLTLFSNNYRIKNNPVLSISNGGFRNILVGTNAGAGMGSSDNSFVGDSAGFLSVNSSANCFMGSKAGYNNTAGGDNIFIGVKSGFSSLMSFANIFVGTNAGYTCGNATHESIFIGYNAGKTITSSTENTFVGYQSGSLGATGNYNSFFGAETGYNTTGSYNLFLGSESGVTNTSGNNNVFTGAYSGRFNSLGSNNTFTGSSAGYSNSNADGNSFYGASSGFNNVVGTANSFFGINSGILNLSNNNSFFGAYSGNQNSSGANNTMIGYLCGQTNSSGVENTFVGSESSEFSTGSFNTSIGYKCAINNLSGNNNTFLGYKADGIASLTNATAIGANSIVTTNNSLVLGGIGANAVKVGIGVSAPSAELEINGFTKAGSNAPAIKMLKFTGTTNAAQGGTINIAHGLISSKILAVNIWVDYALGSSVPPSYNASVGYEYDYYITTTNIIIWNKTGNSSSILSKPFRILITYEQ